MEKEYYTILQNSKRKIWCIPQKTLYYYKTLLGDNSDKIPGVKGLGEKGIFKKFP